jgi:hypothetical protein
VKRISIVVGVFYFVAMAIFVTFPGITVANRVEPYILGLPFVLAWYMGWIVGALFVFGFLHYTHTMIRD